MLQELRRITQSTESRSAILIGLQGRPAVTGLKVYGSTSGRKVLPEETMALFWDEKGDEGEKK